MADTSKLTKFAVEEREGSYQLHIEAEGAEPIVLEATRDQIDVIADTLDDLLANTEDEDLADDVTEGEDEK